MKPTPPKPGQESVWDYPRPPRLEATNQTVRVYFADTLIAETSRPLRMLETSHPPTYYIPMSDIRMDFLRPSGNPSTFCEWKGRARYWDIRVGPEESTAAGWSYPRPSSEYAALLDHLAFYPSRMSACYVNEEMVEAQPGDFYGGWITSNIVGPFKGAQGTWGW